MYGTTVIISEGTHRLAQHMIEARELDIVVVVGKSEPVRIFELLGRIGEVDAGVLKVRRSLCRRTGSLSQGRVEQRRRNCSRSVYDSAPTMDLKGAA